MQLKSLLVNPVTAFILVTFAVSAPISAHADNIGWANWSSATPGTPGSASGTIGSITVTYSGQNSGLLTNYPSWTPTTTFTGGVVSNAPPAATTLFKSRVDRPSPRPSPSRLLSSILSSRSGVLARRHPCLFRLRPHLRHFTVQGGGPPQSTEAHPSLSSGEEVQGCEGNGVIQFDGTYTTISFTTPSFEYYYAFTVGEDATLTSKLPGDQLDPRFPRSRTR